MTAFLSFPAKAMMVFCQMGAGLGFLAFLILLVSRASFLFASLRSKVDAPAERYRLYIQIQLYSGRVVFLCCLLFWLCLCREDPFALSHPLAGLGIIFLPGLVTYIGGQWGALRGMAAYYQNHPTEGGADSETKDTPENHEQQ